MVPRATRRAARQYRPTAFLVNMDAGTAKPGDQRHHNWQKAAVAAKEP
jgi:hypothetical protein